MYRAVGLAAYELYDEIDYDKWYSTQLIHELEITDLRFIIDLHALSIITLSCMCMCRYLLVRYRVVWLLGHWVTVKMSTELRPSLYSCLLQLLHPSERLLVSQNNQLCKYNIIVLLLTSIGQIGSLSIIVLLYPFTVVVLCTSNDIIIISNPIYIQP